MTDDIDWKEWATFQPLEAAQGLRASEDGSGDPLPTAAVREIRKALTERIGAGWKPSRWPARERADAAVREFIAAVLEETKPDRPSE